MVVVVGTKDDGGSSHGGLGRRSDVGCGSASEGDIGAASDSNRYEHSERDRFMGEVLCS